MAGLADPTGAADAAGAGLAAYRGDYLGAAISVLGIFGLDWLKKFRKGGKGGKAAGDALGAGLDAGQAAAKNADDAAQCAARGAGDLPPARGGSPSSHPPGRVRPANPGSRPFPDRLKDSQADPSRWVPESIHSEPATGVKTRGGVSEQIIYRNTETGETLVRHRVTDAKGRVRDDHSRPYYTPRVGEVD